MGPFTQTIFRKVIQAWNLASVFQTEHLSNLPGHSREKRPFPQCGMGTKVILVPDIPVIVKSQVKNVSLGCMGPARLLWRLACVRVAVVGASGGCRASKSCLGDFVGSLPCSRRSRLLVHCILDCLSRACPLWHHTAFLTTRVFYGGDSGPPRGQRSLSFFLSVSIFSLCLSISPSTDPPQWEPRVPVSAGPSGTAWTHDSIRTARICIGVDSFIGNDS